MKLKKLLLVFILFSSFLFAQNFYLHTNGVTCMCPDAAIGETGVVNGVTYTKRTREQITIQNASTTCTSGITDMSGLFQGNQTNPNIVSWDVSSVTNMANMFQDSNFNRPIGNWDVSNVTNMSSMFRNATIFNQNINTWSTSNVTNMESMFRVATAFNQPLNNWDVSNVTNMSSMFRNATIFNQNINTWSTSNVTNMESMFGEATAFNQPLNNWDVSNVTNMAYMFTGPSAFNQPLNNWDVSNVTDMSFMFGSFSGSFNSHQFNQPLNNWDVSNVTSMIGMFQNNYSFNQDLSNWNFNTNIVFGAYTVAFSFINNSGLSQHNYELLLQSFYQQNLVNKYFRSGNMKYCDSSFRSLLISQRGWNIVGDSFLQTSISAPPNLNITAPQGSCFASNFSLGSPITSSCFNYTVTNNAPAQFPLGTTIVTWTITDENETVLTSNQTVIVKTPSGSTTLPTIMNAPLNITIPVDTNSCVATNVNLGVPFAQSCLNYTIANNAPVAFPIGTSQVVWTMTLENGSVITRNQSVTVTIQVDNASLCYVTSDANQPTKNRIFINNTDGLNVLEYRILREVSTNLFQIIGSFPPNQNSFLDESSNNQSQFYKYAIRTVNTCNTSYTNPIIHRTILLQSNIAVNNSVNLSWNSYEGLNYGNYKIYRKIGNGNFEEIATLSASNLSYNDVTANVSNNTYEYYVSIDAPTCTSSQGRFSQNTLSVNQVKSNILNTSTLSVNSSEFEKNVSVFPNPTKDILHIKLNDISNLIKVEVYNSLGQKLIETSECILNVERLPSSNYFLKISTQSSTINKVFIKN